MIKLKYLIIVAIFAIFSHTSFAQSATPSKHIVASDHYEGGQDSMYAFIKRHVKYPMMAKRNRIQGECIVKIVIEADGTAKDYHLVKNIGAGCGDEATRVIKLLKFKAPGYQLQTSIPIIFKL